MLANTIVTISLTGVHVVESFIDRPTEISKLNAIGMCLLPPPQVDTTGGTESGCDV
jgi:hypothetical protein